MRPACVWTQSSMSWPFSPRLARVARRLLPADQQARPRPSLLQVISERRRKYTGIRPAEIAVRLRIGRASVYRVLGQREDVAA